MKKLCFFLAVLLSLCTLAPLYGCASDDEQLVLNIYNWEDYISEEDYVIVDEFENYYEKKYNKSVKVNYSTFGTNENMYNELQLTKESDGKGGYTYSYDLVCPSDYMIQKMLKEGMLEKIDTTKIPEYMNNVSPFIKNIFDENGWTEYAVGYMWGTMGFVYSDYAEDFADENGEVSWANIFDEKYKNLGTIKNSVRDTYALSLGYIFRDELLALDKTDEDYHKKIEEIFNRADAETIKAAGDALKSLKKNIYGFEVDSGKQDMATGKIAINFAWSGDAVYTLDVAEEAGTELYYSVPKEGSNVWFDGWVMPKGANTELAQEFINFISTEESTVANVNYIGYSPVIATEGVYDTITDWYGISSLYLDEEMTVSDYEELDEEEQEYYEVVDDKVYYYAYAGDDVDATNNTLEQKYVDDDGNLATEIIDVYPIDWSYFFAENLEEENVIVYTDCPDRQLTTQIPDKSVVERCSIMKYFDNEQMNMLNDMWLELKIGEMSWTAILLIIVGAVVLVTAMVIVIKLIKNREHQPKKYKDLTLVSRNIIK